MFIKYNERKNAAALSLAGKMGKEADRNKLLDEIKKIFGKEAEEHRFWKNPQAAYYP